MTDKSKKDNKKNKSAEGEKDNTLPSFGAGGPEFQFTSTTQQNRQDIVQSSGDPGLAIDAFVTANLFELTALGASLDLSGHWNSAGGASPHAEGAHSVAPPGGDLSQWRQITTQGRDQYVRIVLRGYLFPLGLRAVLVEVIDRVFLPDPVYPTQHATGYMQLKEFIRITEPTKTYPASGQPFHGRSWPFASITAVTLVSPLLTQPLSSQPGLVNPEHSGDTPQAFMPQANGGDVIWTFHVIDDEQTKATLQLPQAFVYGYDPTENFPGDPFDSSFTSKIAKSYNNLPMSRRSCPLPGTPMKIAPTVNNGPTGGTTHPVLSIEMKAATSVSDPNTTTGWAGDTPGELSAIDQPAFYPALGVTQVRLPAAEALSRSSFNDGTGTGVGLGYFPDYVAYGFPSNLDPMWKTRPSVTRELPHTFQNGGSLYGQLVDQTGTPSPVSLAFPADAVGGLCQPNLGVAGLSAAVGAIGGGLASSLSDFAQTQIASIESYFANLEGTLGQIFGGLPFVNGILSQFKAGPPGLPSLIAGGDMPLDSDTFQVPTMTTTTDPVTGTKTITYSCPVNLQNYDSDSSSPVYNIFTPVNLPAVMNLTAIATVSATAPPTFQVNGTIDPFTVQLFGMGDLYFIQVPFDTVTFTSGSGIKTDVNISVGDVQFEGPLQFVNQLSDLLSDLGGSGLSIDVTPTQVSATLSLAIPNIGVGIFTLDNLALDAGITIPFLGGATVATFSFCSQEAPFQLTVDCAGGGGYVLLSLGMAGVQAVQASFDFAAEVELDLYVASGSVSLSAGITYSWEAAGPNAGTTLTAFVRLVGSASVLGLISVTIELEISLGFYLDPSGNPYLVGTASMSVSISILFLSESVSITVTKKFGAGSLGGLIEHDLDPAIGGTDPFPPPVTTFAGEIDASTWANYCGAFAA
ncbi:MAG: hypothetical protein ACLPQS_06490 [Acidimicrobiales bacterium]